MVAIVTSSTGVSLSPPSIEVRHSPSGISVKAGTENGNISPSLEPSQKQVTEQDVQKAVQQANMEFAGMNQKIGFGYEKRLGQLYVQVLDKQTGEVVKEVPPKEFLEHQAAMKELMGLLVDRKA